MANSIFPDGGGGNGANAELLWTNPEPKVRYAPQTLPLNLSAYEAVFINFVVAAFITITDGVAGISQPEYCPKDGVQRVLGGGARTNDTNDGRACARLVTVTDTGVIFGNVSTGSSFSSTSGYAIPYHVWGVKKAIQFT